MMHNPTHPGEIVQEYMEGLGLTVSALAAHLKITRANLSRMIHGGRPAYRPGMALRLSEAFGTSPRSVDQVTGQLRPYKSHAQPARQNCAIGGMIAAVFVACSTSRARSYSASANANQ